MPNPEGSPVEVPVLTPLPDKPQPEYIPPFTESQVAFLAKMNKVRETYEDIESIDEIQELLAQLSPDHTLPPSLQDLSAEAKEDILPEIFALAGKAIELTTGIKPRDTQYVTANALAHGKIAELPSGEGKTLAVGIANIFAALTNESVHSMTANDYLAKRDLTELGDAYDVFGLKAGIILYGGQDQLVYDPNYPGDDPKFPHLRKIPFVPNVAERSRQAIYGKCNIIYGEVTSFIFDEEIDNMTTNPNYKRRSRKAGDNNSDNTGIRVVANKAFAIADEVDQLAVDQARNPVILSNPEPLSPQEEEELRDIDEFAKTLTHPIYRDSTPGSKLGKLARSVRNNWMDKTNAELATGDYVVKGVDTGHPWIEFTDTGIDKILIKYKMDSDEFFGKHGDIYRKIRNAALAHAKTKREGSEGVYQLYQRGRDYIIAPNNKFTPPHLSVVLLDKYTGRPLPDTVLTQGLHQALEAKEGLKHICGETGILDASSIQSYLRSYDTFAGTTGTAQEAEDIFRRIYDREVEIIPPHKPLRLTTLPTELFENNTQSHQKILKIVEEVHSKAFHADEDNEPFLICVSSVEEADSLAALFDEHNKKVIEVNKTAEEKDRQPELRYSKLTGADLTKESEVIASAGIPNMITIATFVAGRGTHIEPGGAKPLQSDGKPYPEDSEKYEAWQERHDKVISMGGLRVIAADVPTAREMMQLQRRTARNGEPGTFQIVASMYSPTFLEYGYERALRLNKKMTDKDLMISMIQGSIAEREMDSLEQVVHTDNVISGNRYEFGQFKDEILLPENEWLQHVPQHIKAVLHERLQSLYHLPADFLNNDPDQLARYIDELLALPGLKMYQLTTSPMRFTTTAKVNEYLKQKAQEENRHFYDLQHMSPEEQEKAITEVVFNKYDTLSKQLGPTGSNRLLRETANQILSKLWTTHLLQTQDILSGIFLHQRPLDEYARKATELLEEEMAAAKEYLLLTFTQTEQDLKDEELLIWLNQPPIPLHPNRFEEVTNATLGQIHNPYTRETIYPGTYLPQSDGPNNGLAIKIAGTDTYGNILAAIRVTKNDKVHFALCKLSPLKSGTALNTILFGSGAIAWLYNSNAASQSASVAQQLKNWLEGDGPKPDCVVMVGENKKAVPADMQAFLDYQPNSLPTLIQLTI